MRLQLCLALALLVGTPLTGCLGSGGEDLEQTASPETNASEPANASDDGETASGGNTTADRNTTTDDPDANRTQAPGGGGGGSDPVQAPPMATVAHIDTGINPYHEAFRDDSELAYTHPSEYIDGFPEDAEALNLSLDADTYEDARERDADVWSNVTDGELYWIPGTRIVGAISLDDGGTREGRNETKILDDHGHGTMTASRAVGERTSLAPDARLVSIEGLGAEQVRWAADAGWIDVQTNSWIDVVPPPANQQQDEIPEAGTGSTSEAFAHAADEMVTLAASGNGLAYQAGFAPTPTFTLATAPDGVLLVGAHDNGHVTPWSGSPPHVVADGFRPLAAVFDSMDAVEPHAYACCTSASAPYAAGGVASLVSQARAALDDRSLGIEDGVVAEGDTELAAGPMDDGELSRAELESLFLHTAQRTPLETTHDGDTHWAADPQEDEPRDPTGPGENAYCVGCLSAPITFNEIPDEVPTYLYTGYGAINVFSDRAALNVLLGAVEEPGREDADRFYDADQSVRETYYP